MYIYVIKDDECIETVSLINASDYELGQEIHEIMDKNGEGTRVLVSEENVTDPIKELILGEEAIEA
jgi:hypothetical protein